MSPRLCIALLTVTGVSSAGAPADTLYARLGGNPGIAAFVGRALAAAPRNSARR